MSAENGLFASLSRTRQARRDRLLAAAERVFTRIGLKAATVEGIAEEAQVSKATLYAYFPDKTAVFVAVAERLAIEMRTRVSAALMGEGSLQDRIAAALMAKHGLAFDVVIGSPNAAELLETRNHLVRDIFLETDRAIETAILEALQASGDPEPAATARLIFNASIGISEHARARDELESDLKRLVAAVLNA
jgi:AcrR family transcriptional regulator